MLDPHRFGHPELAERYARMGRGDGLLRLQYSDPTARVRRRPVRPAQYHPAEEAPQIGPVQKRGQGRRLCCASSRNSMNTAPHENCGGTRSLKCSSAASTPCMSGASSRRWAMADFTVVDDMLALISSTERTYSTGMASEALVVRRRGSPPPRGRATPTGRR